MTFAVETLSPLFVCRGGRSILEEQVLAIESGTLTLLTGPNGSGKSTLLQSLFALLPIRKGIVRLLGSELPSASTRTLFLSGGRYLSQYPRYFPHLTVAQQRRLLQVLYGMKSSLTRDTTFDNATRYNPLSRPTFALSIGERKVEAMRMLFAGSPKLLLLDEPIAGLGGFHLDWVLSTLREFRNNGGTAIVAEHETNDLSDIIDGQLALSTQ